MGSGLAGGTMYNDYYKYDPTNDSWTAIASMSVSIFTTTQFVINNKGYVGTGSETYPNQAGTNHFWEYDPANNTWTAIPNMGGTIRLTAAAFSIGNIGYCGTGAYQDYTLDLTEFWQYAPASDVGTYDLQNQNIDISVYPNPSSGFIKLNYTTTKPSNVNIQVLDIDGKIILVQSEKQIAGINQFSIDLSHKSRGIYFIEFISGTEKIVKKIVFE